MRPTAFLCGAQGEKRIDLKGGSRRRCSVRRILQWRASSVAEQPTWRLIITAAKRLTGTDGSAFKLEDLVAEVQRMDPDRGRGSIQPVVQGMTRNAGKGPASAAGKILRRESRGYYVLTQSPARVSAAPKSSGKRRVRVLTATELRARVDDLCDTFGACISEFDRQPAFTRAQQLAHHRRTINRRRELGTVDQAVHDGEFLRGLRLTLAAWGLSRGSNLVLASPFNAALRRHADEIANLEALSIEDLAAADVPDLSDQIYRLITRLGVVKSAALIVAGTKTLHHLLPDLVPPMDRTWTGSFFGWAEFDPQNHQEAIFTEAFTVFAEVARRTKPSRAIGDKWRTSSTKVLDNAVVGYCKLHRLGPTTT